MLTEEAHCPLRFREMNEGAVCDITSSSWAGKALDEVGQRETFPGGSLTRRGRNRNRTPIWLCENT